MHIEYQPESVDFWIHFYKGTIEDQPQLHYGGEIEGYKAYRPLIRQRGAGLGSFFKSLYRFMLPVLTSAGKHALTAGSKIAADLAQGQKFQDTALKRGREAAGAVLHDTANKISGEGLSKKKRSTKLNKKTKRGASSSVRGQKSSHTVGRDIFGVQK